MKLQIGHLDYEVRRPIATEEADMIQAGMAACCYPARGVILVRHGYRPTMEAELLVHEALHGAWHAFTVPDKLDEEGVCTRLAGPLVSFMRDNPSAVSAIIAASQGVPLPIN